MARDPLLSSSTRRSRYKFLEVNRDREAIAAFFTERFTERYVTPIEATPRKQKHGFTVMAVSCLLIETLESFWNGWPSTDGRSALAFCQFISRSPRFHFLLGHVPAFYRHVRCGILHQAETTGGWTIKRIGPLFDRNGLVLNATAFHRKLQKEISDYANILRTEHWDTDDGAISGKKWQRSVGTVKSAARQT